MCDRLKDRYLDYYYFFEYCMKFAELRVAILCLNGMAAKSDFTIMHFIDLYLNLRELSA